MFLRDPAISRERSPVSRQRNERAEQQNETLLLDGGLPGSGVRSHESAANRASERAQASSSRRLCIVLMTAGSRACRKPSPQRSLQRPDTLEPDESQGDMCRQSSRSRSRSGGEGEQKQEQE